MIDEELRDRDAESVCDAFDDVEAGGLGGCTFDAADPRPGDAGALGKFGLRQSKSGSLKKHIRSQNLFRWRASASSKWRHVECSFSLGLQWSIRLDDGRR